MVVIAVVNFLVFGGLKGAKPAGVVVPLEHFFLHWRKGSIRQMCVIVIPAPQLTFDAQDWLVRESTQVTLG